MIRFPYQHFKRTGHSPSNNRLYDGPDLKLKIFSGVV